MWDLKILEWLIKLARFQTVSIYTYYHSLKMFLLHIFPLNMFYASHNLDATENCVPLNNKKKSKKNKKQKTYSFRFTFVLCIRLETTLC